MSEITLVTGGAGFVGHHLVNKLREQGQTVRSFDLSAPRHSDDIQGSVLDMGAVASAMVGVSSIFHLAGNAQLWAADNLVFNQVNFIGTKNIVDSAPRSCVSMPRKAPVRGRDSRDFFRPPA